MLQLLLKNKLANLSKKFDPLTVFLICIIFLLLIGSGFIILEKSILQGKYDKLQTNYANLDSAYQQNLKELKRLEQNAIADKQSIEALSAAFVKMDADHRKEQERLIKEASEAKQLVTEQYNDTRALVTNIEARNRYDILMAKNITSTLSSTYCKLYGECKDE